MSKLTIKYLNRSELIPYANNARTHTEGQIKQIAASIKEFGFTNPILIDENNGIIAGHGRLSAAEILKFDPVPTIQLKGLSDAQRRAYIIADNKLALNAGWSMELLNLELEKLEQFDLTVLGFDQNELNSILGITQDPENTMTNEDEYLIIVELQNEAEQETLFSKLQGDGYKARMP